MSFWRRLTWWLIGALTPVMIGHGAFVYWRERSLQVHDVTNELDVYARLVQRAVEQTQRERGWREAIALGQALEPRELAFAADHRFLWVRRPAGEAPALADAPAELGPLADRGEDRLARRDSPDGRWRVYRLVRGGDGAVSAFEVSHDAADVEGFIRSTALEESLYVLLVAIACVVAVTLVNRWQVRPIVARLIALARSIDPDGPPDAPLAPGPADATGATGAGLSPAATGAAGVTGTDGATGVAGTDGVIGSGGTIVRAAHNSTKEVSSMSTAPGTSGVGGAIGAAVPVGDEGDEDIERLADEMHRMQGRIREARLALGRETAAKLAMAEQLRHADRLALVGRLAAGVAHEFGTPLAVVRGRARLVLDHPEVPDDAAASARVVVEQVDRMAHIIRQLLDLARRRGPAAGPCDLSLLLERMAGLLEHEASRRQVTIAFEPPPAPVRARGDLQQLEQVALNMVMNAIQALDGRGGRVTLRCGVGPSSDRVWFLVEDDGPGITPELMADIFEPFVTTKESGVGTGLGLPLSAGIVRDHGGHIEATSVPDQRTTFRVELPAWTPDDAAPPARPPRAEAPEEGQAPRDAPPRGGLP